MVSVGIDIDGVLTDYSKFVLDRADRFSKSTGIQANKIPDNIEAVDWHGKNNEKMFWDIYAEQYLNLPISDETKVAIWLLHSNGIRICIISARRDDGMWGKGVCGIDIRSLYWYKSNDVPYDAFVCTQGKSKRPFVEAYHVDYMLDDDPKHISDLADATEFYLLDKPYNQDVMWKNRAKSVMDFCKMVVKSTTLKL